MLHTLVQSLTSPSGQKSASLQFNAAAVLELDEAIAAVTTNQAVALSFVVAKVVSIFILTDADLTLKTNSSSSPTNTIALKSGVAYFWFTPNAYNACLFTSDVTTAFLTNAGANAANCYIRILYTP